ncbi:hypothetical protein niasHT_030816 [Heterodera trifolii]|uniref:Cell cycle checkpoint control protein n=1 Tax=Heterodera trifolii TaxID=157864 RepID=A0ABD2HT40_9BILA
MPSPTPEVTFKDRSVHEIHLENGYTYVIEQNLKHFASVITVLAKFSEQILLQPTEDGLVLSASSSARSAYAKVKLCRQFFDRLRARENLGPDGEVFCRLATKSLMHIFKSAAQSSVGPVPSCSLELDPQSDFAYVHLQCLSGIRRCFVLSLREYAMVCDNVFNERQRLKNRVTAHAKMLATLLSPLDCSDLELVALADRFTACRYIPREEYGKVRRTEVQIPVDHCEQYRIEVPTRVVVNLRELRPILQFADLCGMSVSLHFDRAGRPLIVAVEENVDFAAEFVLGTLDEQLPLNEQQQQPTPQQQQQPVVQQREEQPPPQHRQNQMPRHHSPAPAAVAERVEEEQNETTPNRGQMSIGPTPILAAAAIQQQEVLNDDTPPSQGQLLRRPSPTDAAERMGEEHNETPPNHGQMMMMQQGEDVQLSIRSTPILAIAALQQQEEHNETAPNHGQMSIGPTPILAAAAAVQQQQETHNETLQNDGQMLRPSPTPVAVVEREEVDETPPSQGQMLRRPSPTLEFVDPNEIPLERYMMSEPFQRLSVVPRPEGMSVWEQDSDVGSRVHSSSIVSLAGGTGGGGGAGTTAARNATTTGWMSKRSASQRGKR